MAEWCSFPYFCMKLREKYLACRPYLAALLADGGTYDRHVSYIRESGIANENRWFYRAGFSGPTGDAAVFKRFLKDRLDWLDDRYPEITNNPAQFASDAAYDGLAEGASPFGKSIPLWQDYIAGTDPMDEDDRFTANIAVTNEQVFISWHPDLKGARVYTVKGAAELTDDFTEPTNSASRFFKVEVSLP